MAAGIPARLTPAEGRKFGLTVGIAFAVLGGIVLWRGKETPAYVLLGLGGVLVLAGLVIPAQLGPVQRAWMGLAHAISKVTTPIFMGVVYFVVLTPVGLLMRAMGKNPLAPPAKGSIWHAREPGARRSDLTRQF